MFVDGTDHSSMTLTEGDEDFGIFGENGYPLMTVAGKERFGIVGKALIQVFFGWFLENLNNLIQGHVEYVDDLCILDTSIQNDEELLRLLKKQI